MPIELPDELCNKPQVGPFELYINYIDEIIYAVIINKNSLLMNFFNQSKEEHRVEYN